MCYLVMILSFCIALVIINIVYYHCLLHSDCDINDMNIVSRCVRI